MGSYIEFIKPTISVNYNQYLCIINTCSKILLKGLITFDELKNDINTIIQYSDIEKKYLRKAENKDEVAVWKPNKIYNIDFSKNEEIKSYVGEEWFPYDSTDVTEILVNAPVNKLTGVLIDTSFDLLKPRLKEGVEYLVFYHNYFHISFMVEHELFPDGVCSSQLLKLLSEFTLVETLFIKDPSLVLLAKDIFDKKEFKTLKLLEEKINKFMDLYDDSTKLTSVTEEDRFKEVLSRFFIVNKESNDRILASLLYRQLCRYLDITHDYSTQCRLKTYLIQANIEKRRFAEGNCYVGIREKKTMRLEQF